ncbi:MAG: DUF2029 domain-containing protein [Nitrososphaera sp.]|nr:DUF2029 domain-containing protein [Nitrososphaera sp.]
MTKHRLDLLCKSLLVVIFLWLAGIMFYASRDRWGKGDFAAFYAGAQIAGTAQMDQLYQVEPGYRLQQELWGPGNYQPDVTYIRLPFYALLLKPLTLFEYNTAHWIWFTLRLAAVAGFIFLWPGKRSDSALLVAVTVAIPMGLFSGQDSVLLLPLLALFYRWLETRPLLAGLVLSLCAIKPHLFILVAVLVIVQRRWEALRGALAGGACLVPLSFLAGGRTWLWAFLDAATAGRTNPVVDRMYNLHGLLQGNPLEPLAYALIALVAAVAFSRLPASRSLALALIGGMLISHHAYYPDVVILIPAVLLLQAEGWTVKALALAALSPLALFAPIVGQLVLVALFAAASVGCDKWQPATGRWEEKECSI